MSRQVHSKEAQRLINKWWSDEKDSPTYQLALKVSSLPDAEMRPLLLARIEADSPEADAAREVLALLVVGDPPHDPAALLAELDTLAREQEALRQRALALAAKYRAIEPWADLWSRDGVQTESGFEGYVHGDLNIGWTAGALSSGAVQMIEGAQGYLAEARDYAAEVRVYDGAEPAETRLTAETPPADVVNVAELHEVARHLTATGEHQRAAVIRRAINERGYSVRDIALDEVAAEAALLSAHAPDVMVNARETGDRLLRLVGEQR